MDSVLPGLSNVWLPSNEVSPQSARLPEGSLRSTPATLAVHRTNRELPRLYPESLLWHAVESQVLAANGANPAHLAADRFPC
jgi:hypothetical protein